MSTEKELNDLYGTVHEPYFLEVGENGCVKCGHNKTWDIIQPDGVALATTYGDYEEAEEICDMLNIAYALGRASNGESN